MDNTQLWQAVAKTDPAFTKQFSRGGGFKGTATNATYLARKATEQFGPCGIGWGVQVVDEEMIEGAPLLVEGQVVAHERIHKVRAKLWYVRDGQRGEVEQFGQTQMVGKNKNGFFTDEEAPKKSLTDAMSKCLSLLGFSADIHLGLYDDNKYVAELREEFAPKEAVITEEQASTIRDWIDSTKSDTEKFCALFGVAAVADIPATLYDKAIAALKQKAEKAKAA